jgi:Cd2+/Zn2+-exporting ATPase
MKNNAKAVSGRNKTAATTKPKEAVKTISKSAKNGHEGHNHDEHDHEGGEGHDHEHGGIFGKNTEMIFAILCGAALGAGFGLSFIHTLPSWVNLTFYIVAYFFGGFFTAKEAVKTILKGGFEIDFLMLVAAAGAAILGAWVEGALLLFLFSLGHSLEHYAMGKARKSIAALTSLAPPTALVSRDGKQEEIRIEELQLGDIIIIKPNSKIPADGVVVKGEGSVNQAPITGESVPAEKSPVPDAKKDYAAEKNIKPEYRVFAGTINGASALEVKVIKEAKDSTISRLVKMVNEAEKQKSPTQLFTDKFEKYFVPSVLILVVLLCFAFLVIHEPFSKSFYRAMAVLVAASPCALAISTPSAVLSGVARAARGGVLIKGGRPLEDLGALNAIAFDKTGTLTEGKPQLTNVLPLNNIDEQELLQIVIAVEKLSDHPLAEAIVKGAEEKLKNKKTGEAKNVKGITGRGVQADLDGKKIWIGNKALFAKEKGGIPEAFLKQVEDLEKGGHTTMLVKRDGDFIGLLSLMDVPRKEAKNVLAELTALGIKKMIMLTGDNQQVAEAVAKQIGITEAWGNLMPEDKVEAVSKLNKSEKMVAMVGDGVNDAPAMAKSTVGIAMGAAGSDVALETADIALMGDKLESLPFAIGLSRKARGIIKQNLCISLGMVAVLIPLTLLGIASIGPAVIAHEGSTLIVVFNALRLLAYKNDYQENTQPLKTK